MNIQSFRLWRAAAAALLALGGCVQVPYPVAVPVAAVYPAYPPAAGEPVLDIDPGRHGNMAAAQQLVRSAYDRVSAAQSANNDQLGGHAARAKELLRQANEEIKLAAVTANQR